MMLQASHINDLFSLLNEELGSAQIRGEIFVVGGAVMCIAHHARPSTADVDAYFIPTSAVRLAAERVGNRIGVGPGWLNDAVKGYLSERGEFLPFLELTHLRVMVATPEYLLAMKCLALRLGAEFHDLDDVRFLLRTLNITRAADALRIIGSFYPEERFPPKATFLLQELLADSSVL